MDELRNHFEGKLGFVHSPFGSGLLRIDKEAELLGVPNDDPGSIPVWIAALKGEQKKQSQSLLLRYTNQRIRGNPAQWTAWYDEHKDSLECRDEEGYRFYVREDPKELIIGDSNSLGYTPFIIEQLIGEAKVVHNAGNARPTQRGLENIDSWLGDEDWDVIRLTRAYGICITGGTGSMINHPRAMKGILESWVSLLQRK